MTGKVVRARLDRHYADTRIGHSAFILDGGTIIEPSFATIRGITLVKATPEERRALTAAGYELQEEPP